MLRGLAIVALLALPQVAPAQEVKADPAWMCSATGAFDETFGATRLAGKLRFETEYSVYFLPRKRYPPFVQSHESFNAGVTAKGHRIFSVTTSVFYTTYAAADGGYRPIGSQIAAGGWNRVGEKTT